MGARCVLSKCFPPSSHLVPALATEHAGPGWTGCPVYNEETEPTEVVTCPKLCLARDTAWTGSQGSDSEFRSSQDTWWPLLAWSQCFPTSSSLHPCHRPKREVGWPPASLTAGARWPRGPESLPWGLPADQHTASPGLHLGWGSCWSLCLDRRWHWLLSKTEEGSLKGLQGQQATQGFL